MTSPARRVLYHGTSAARWPAIQKEGLRPRYLTGRRSNWTGDLRSRTGFVYLTDAYPAYYALAAASARSGLLLLRVEVDEDALYPDEDFVAWAIAKGDAARQRELMPLIDPGEYPELWPDSLRLNGVVCTASVPPDRILAHRVVRPDAVDLLMHLGADAMPTPLNYRFLGARYRAALDAFFEHGEAAALAVQADPADSWETPDER